MWKCWKVENNIKINSNSKMTKTIEDIFLIILFVLFPNIGGWVGSFALRYDMYGPFTGIKKLPPIIVFGILWSILHRYMNIEPIMMKLLIVIKHYFPVPSATLHFWFLTVYGLLEMVLIKRLLLQWHYIWLSWHLIGHGHWFSSDTTRLAGYGNAKKKHNKNVECMCNECVSFCTGYTRFSGNFNIGQRMCICIWAN